MSISVVMFAYCCFGSCLVIFSQIPDFVSARVDFGTDLAISTRTELDPGDSAGMSFNLYIEESVFSNVIVCGGTLW